MPCSPGMSECKRGCLHRRFVMDYRIERHAAEILREEETGAYATEIAAYPAIITFKKWLVDHAGGQEHDVQTDVDEEIADAG